MTRISPAVVARIAGLFTSSSGRADGDRRTRAADVPVAAAGAWAIAIASAPLAFVVPVHVAGLAGDAGNWSGSITWLLWMPMLVFELMLAAWLIVKGVQPR